VLQHDRFNRSPAVVRAGGAVFGGGAAAVAARVDSRHEAAARWAIGVLLLLVLGLVLKRILTLP